MDASTSKYVPVMNVPGTSFTKVSYSLIEIKLRRFIYLGHQNSIYVSPKHQKTFWKNGKDLYELNCVLLIGKILKKNKTEEIDSIIPIILKIEQEKKLENYEYIMYLLAVCAKFKHQKLSTDTYAVVEKICTDGFKLLMFYRFCNSAAKILHTQGYTPKTSMGYGNGSRKAFEKFYLQKNPIETIESIIKQKKFRGISHKTIMDTIHLDSEDPSHKMYIVYIRFGINKMEEMFGPRMREVKDSEETIYSKEQQCIYNYIKLVHRIENSKESKSLSEVKWNILGKHFELIVPKMLQSTEILISFVQHLPLRTLLENTYTFHKHGLFKNLSGEQGCIEFMSRFKNCKLVNESGIHPIDSWLAFLRYERTGAVIASLKKRKNNNESRVIVTKEVEQESSDNLEQEIDDPKKSHQLLRTPLKNPVEKLRQFLSVDLVRKTLKNLKPSGRKILIAYDNRMCMESINCRYMHLKFLKVADAITMIIQSIVYQEKPNKPVICGLYDKIRRFRFVKINYQQNYSPKALRKRLFKGVARRYRQYQLMRPVRPLSTVQWAESQRNNKIDTFLFLGTSKMIFSCKKKIKAFYEAYRNIKTKIIVCCLDGKHVERVNLSRDGMLFLSGFDKNTIRIINLFMNDTI